jgi:hypothetical protein
MTDKPKGIIDPWRTVDPVHPPARERASRPERIDLEDIDFDVDLAIPGQYVIRSAHVSFRIVSTRLEEPKDALDVLITCILELAKTKLFNEAFRGAGIGVRRGNTEYNTPAPGAPASTLKAEERVIWFEQKSLDAGMLVLARILRMPECATACKKHGITVML